MKNSEVAQFTWLVCCCLFCSSVVKKWLIVIHNHNDWCYERNTCWFKWIWHYRICIRNRLWKVLFWDWELCKRKFTSSKGSILSIYLCNGSRGIYGFYKRDSFKKYCESNGIIVWVILLQLDHIVKSVKKNFINEIGWR